MYIVSRLVTCIERPIRFLAKSWARMVRQAAGNPEISEEDRNRLLIRELFAGTSDGIAVTDTSGVVTSCNDRLGELLESILAGRKALAGLVLESLIAEAADSGVRRVPLEGREPDGQIFRLYDDANRCIEVTIRHLPDGGKLWFFSDNPEFKSIEPRLQRFQHLETLGKTTGQVAHDFNNVLSAITFTLPVLRARRQDRQGHDQALQSLQDAAEMGASLTQRLLAFSKKQMLEPEIVEINELINGLKELIAMSLGDSIDLSVRCYEEPMLARVDPGQLESALLNLCLNSAHAIEGQGNVTITARPAQGDRILIEVADDGHGMKQEVLERAVEPFFSTRRSDEGSGLGLSMVYGFTRQSGGEFSIESKPGHGTKVCMIIPCFGAGEEMTSNSDAGAIARGSTIMLVEDEDATRRFTADILHRLGHETIECASYEEADRLMTNGAPFEILLTDVNLGGGRSGWELARQCASQARSRRIIVTSGRIGELDKPSDMFGERVAVLEKPFTLSDIRELLEPYQYPRRGRPHSVSKQVS